MFSKLIANTLYVKVFKNRFELLHIESGRSISVISQGGFTTSRLLVGQFTEAEETLGNGVKELYRDNLLATSPVVIMHPVEKVEDGLSQVEERVIQELAASVGARNCLVWVGKELPDQEVIKMTKGM